MSQETDDRIDQLRAVLATADQLRQNLIDTQDSLAAEVYRLDISRLRMQMAEDEIQKLESLTLTGILSALKGDKPGRIDALREECRALEIEHEERTRTVETIQRQVEKLKEQIASLAEAEAELQTLCPGGIGLSNTPGSPQAAGTGLVHRLEMAIEAGESLLNRLNGMYLLYGSLKRGPAMGSQAGALISTAMRACRGRTAGSVTEEIADSVRYFCDQINELGLASDDPAVPAILVARSQIEKFADSGGAILGERPDEWAELEILARGLMTDLRDMLAHNTGSQR
jgi:hypothetical protein